MLPYSQVSFSSPPCFSFVSFSLSFIFLSCTWMFISKLCCVELSLSDIKCRKLRVVLIFFWFSASVCVVVLFVIFWQHPRTLPHIHLLHIILHFSIYDVAKLSSGDAEDVSRFRTATVIATDILEVLILQGKELTRLIASGDLDSKSANSEVVEESNNRNTTINSVPTYIVYKNKDT